MYGEYGSGKTAIGLELVAGSEKALFISTDGSLYKARVYSSPDRFKRTLFIDAGNQAELFLAMVEASMKDFKVVVVDTINSYLRNSRNYRVFMESLQLALGLCKERQSRVVLMWQVSKDGEAYGEKYMKTFSGTIFRLEKGKIENINTKERYCFKVTKNTVYLC